MATTGRKPTDLKGGGMSVRYDTPKRVKDREQGWGTINTAMSFIGAWCIIRYGFHHTPNSIVLVVGVSIPGVVKAWVPQARRKGATPR